MRSVIDTRTNSSVNFCNLDVSEARLKTTLYYPAEVFVRNLLQGVVIGCLKKSKACWTVIISPNSVVAKSVFQNQVCIVCFFPNPILKWNFRLCGRTKIQSSVSPNLRWCGGLFRFVRREILHLLQSQSGSLWYWTDLYPKKATVRW